MPAAGMSPRNSHEASGLALMALEMGRATGIWFFFSSRRRHTRCSRDWSSDVCSSDLLFASFSRCALDLREVHAKGVPRRAREQFKRCRTQTCPIAGRFRFWARWQNRDRSEEHTSELQSRLHLVCRLLLEKKKHMNSKHTTTPLLPTPPPEAQQYKRTIYYRRNPQSTTHATPCSYCSQPSYLDAGPFPRTS